MSGAVINTRLVDERRKALNLSIRALKQAAALGHHAVYAADPDAHAFASMTLGELSRLAAALGVTAAELLTSSDTSTASDASAGDAAVLLAALMDEAQVTLAHKDDIARALGWPLEQVEHAISYAAAALPTLGLSLHQHPAGGLGLRVAHGVLSAEAQQRLARAKTHRTCLRTDHARVLREVACGKIDARWRMVPSQKQRVPIQGLRKRGLIEDTPAGPRLTPTAAFSLLLTDEPPPQDISQSAGLDRPEVSQGASATLDPYALHLKARNAAARRSGTPPSPSTTG